MKNIFKKIAILGFAAVMLFAVAGLTGCAGSRVECICDDNCYGTCNFELTIEVESFILEAQSLSWIGMHYVAEYPPVVMATLRNVSGRRKTIARRDHTRTAVSFIMSIPTGEMWSSASAPFPPPIFGWRWVSTGLRNGDSISRIPHVRQYNFPLGEHEATVSAGFYVNHRSNNRQLIWIDYTFIFEVI